MQPPRRRVYAQSLPLLLATGAFGLFGCASPGPPRPPSLGIPRAVTNLTATRSGDTVSLQFTYPTRTTDELPLRAATLKGYLCRQAAVAGPCIPVDAEKNGRTVRMPDSPAAAQVQWSDALPAGLTTGSPRPIAYRVELQSEAGRSAGFSDPAYTVAGLAPPMVRGLHAEPMRLGIALHWEQVQNGGEVLLSREGPTGSPQAEQRTPARDAVETSPPRSGARTKKTAPPFQRSSRPRSSAAGPQLLQAAPGDPSAARTVDAGVDEGVTYRYTAARQVVVKLEGRTLQLRSAPSETAEATWRDVYPPAAPTGLVALGYNVAKTDRTAPEGVPGVFAVDLVWQPVEDQRLQGYIVYRQEIGAAGQTSGLRVKLTPEPVVTPGFHDSTAKASKGYRYTVTAIDPRGNESGAAEANVDPAASSAAP